MGFVRSHKYTAMIAQKGLSVKFAARLESGKIKGVFFVSYREFFVLSEGEKRDIVKT